MMNQTLVDGRWLLAKSLSVARRRSKAKALAHVGTEPNFCQSLTRIGSNRVKSDAFANS